VLLLPFLSPLGFLDLVALPGVIVGLAVVSWATGHVGKVLRDPEKRTALGLDILPKHQRSSRSDHQLVWILLLPLGCAVAVRFSGFEIIYQPVSISLLFGITLSLLVSPTVLSNALLVLYGILGVLSFHFPTGENATIYGAESDAIFALLLASAPLIASRVDLSDSHACSRLFRALFLVILVKESFLGSGFVAPSTALHFVSPPRLEYIADEMDDALSQSKTTISGREASDPLVDFSLDDIDDDFGVINSIEMDSVARSEYLRVTWSTWADHTFLSWSLQLLLFELAWRGTTWLARRLREESIG
jgi:hypothetical protein